MIFFQDISINLGSIVSFIILKDSIKVLIVGNFARGNFPVPDKKTILQKISHYSCYIFISQSTLHMFDLTITFHISINTFYLVGCSDHDPSDLKMKVSYLLKKLCIFRTYYRK